MQSAREELTIRLHELADDVDISGVRRVQEGVATARRRRRRLVFAVAVGGMAAAMTVASLNYAGVLGGESSPPGAAQTPRGLPGDGGPGDELPVVAPGEPCPGAEHAGSAEALDTRTPRWTPTNTQLTDAWTCGDTPVLLYGNVQVSYEIGYRDLDAKAHVEGLAKEYGGTVETVLDRPAWVFSPTSPEQHSSVQLIVGDVLIRVLAKGDVPVASLVSLTNRIELPASEQ